MCHSHRGTDDRATWVVAVERFESSAQRSDYRKLPRAAFLLASRRRHTSRSRALSGILAGHSAGIAE